MPINQVYGGRPETAIASYDYSDIAEGTGVKTFYGFNVNTSGAATADRFRLGQQSSLNSYDVETAMTAKAAYNWELTAFNLPKTIKGTAIIRCSTNYNGNAAETAYLLFD